MHLAPKMNTKQLGSGLNNWGQVLFGGFVAVVFVVRYGESAY